MHGGCTGLTRSLGRVPASLCCHFLVLLSVGSCLHSEGGIPTHSSAGGGQEAGGGAPQAAVNAASLHATRAASLGVGLHTLGPPAAVRWVGWSVWCIWHGMVLGNHASCWVLL